MFTGRFVWKTSRNLDVALLSELSTKAGTSDLNSRLFFDLHGEILGLHMGFGISDPLELEESWKVGPRVCLTNELTAFTTIAEEGRYIFGATYRKSGYKFEGAYAESNRVWYARFSKSFKSSIGTVCPELRLDILPDDEVVGVGLSVLF